MAGRTGHPGRRRPISSLPYRNTRSLLPERQLRRVVRGWVAVGHGSPSRRLLAQRQRWSRKARYARSARASRPTRSARPAWKIRCTRASRSLQFMVTARLGRLRTRRDLRSIPDELDLRAQLSSNSSGAACSQSGRLGDRRCHSGAVSPLVLSHAAVGTVCTHSLGAPASSRRWDNQHRERAPCALLRLLVADSFAANAPITRNNVNPSPLAMSTAAPATNRTSVTLAFAMTSTNCSN